MDPVLQGLSLSIVRQVVQFPPDMSPDEKVELVRDYLVRELQYTDAEIALLERVPNGMLDPASYALPIEEAGAGPTE